MKKKNYEVLVEDSKIVLEYSSIDNDIVLYIQRKSCNSNLKFL